MLEVRFLWIVRRHRVKLRSEAQAPALSVPTPVAALWEPGRGHQAMCITNRGGNECSASALLST